MAKNISQKVIFDTTSNRLYKFYMDEKLHTELTGAKTKVSKEIGSAFKAGDNYIKGKMLFLKPNNMIVQTWRGADWAKTDLDSILILTFKELEGEKTQLEMMHTNVPDQFAEDIKNGWKEHYWNLWKAYIKSKK